MTLIQLRAFLAVFDGGSFTEAGRVLGVTQASMSELIARLEEELGLALFVRGGRKLVPTSAARELRTHAWEAVAAADRAAGAMASLSSLTGGTCTFGVLRNASYYDLADLAHEFHSHYPDVQLRLEGLNSAIVAKSVQEGNLEAGIVVLPVDIEGLRVTPLLEDDVLFCTSEQLSSSTVDIAELSRSPVILYDAHAGDSDPTRRQIAKRLKSEGLSIRPTIEVEHVETALALVARGIGTTFISASIKRDGHLPKKIYTYPFTDSITETIALVQRERSALSPLTQKMFSLVWHRLRRHAGLSDSQSN